MRFGPESSQTLTHWGRVTHICVGKLIIIGSDNGLSSDRRQAIISTNAGLLSIGPLRAYFSENLIKIQQFSLKKMHVKMLSAKWRSSCLGSLNVLMIAQDMNQCRLAITKDPRHSSHEHSHEVLKISVISWELPVNFHEKNAADPFYFRDWSSVSEINFKLTHLALQSHLPGASECIRHVLVVNFINLWLINNEKKPKTNCLYLFTWLQSRWMKDYLTETQWHICISKLTHY